MDFFASQELARRNTRKLVGLLIVTMIALVGSVYLLVLVAFGILGQRSDAAWTHDPWVYVYALLATVVAVFLVVGFGSITKTWELRAGGESIAHLLRGRRLLPNSADLAERRLLNVVEEMALAAGMPVPPVYVLDHEPGINAFAAGHTVDDAIIGVNRGTLETLNRDELQGVIGHEFSHILNGDMRMSLRLIGILHGVQAIALIGYFLIRLVGSTSRRSSSNDKKGDPTIVLLILGAGLLAIGSVGLFFARIIKASISRQREFLADASSVQFTRNPSGIGGALKMIATAQSTSAVRSENAESISHMFFANMTGGLGASLLATHPPLVKRITEIEPRFDGDFQGYLRSRARPGLTQREMDEQRDRQVQRLNPMGGRFGPGGSLLEPLLVISAIGAPTDDDVIYSQILIGQIPKPLLQAARDSFSARCLVFASLLDDRPEIRATQMQMIRASEGDGSAVETNRLWPMVSKIDMRYRMPLFEILQGTLVGLSAPQYAQFRKILAQLIAADQEVSLFEFFLRHHLVIHLDRHFGEGLPHPVKHERLADVREEFIELITILAQVGHRDQSAALAFSAGLESVKELKNEAFHSRPLDFARLAQAIKKLSHASPLIKKQLLAAAATTVAFDQQVTVEEAEMFRAFSESLDCPVPPLVATISSSDL